MNYHDKQHRLWMLQEALELIDSQAVDENSDLLLQMYEEIEQIIKETEEKEV